MSRVVVGSRSISQANEQVIIKYNTIQNQTKKKETRICEQTMTTELTQKPDIDTVKHTLKQNKQTKANRVTL